MEIIRYVAREAWKEQVGRAVDDCAANRRDRPNAGSWLAAEPQGEFLMLMRSKVALTPITL